ncbi:hypothetical protein HNY73_013663 [Argiope bruennichi]|uniref:Reverse transcriptase domain-containing protein n=1 Tax=Argiope bruennichi TaxID=94029 RepID=A0A8T0F3I7_ARGBR|nr:hypothetical protein HNY73_013663 [Argiope bruennichi]
MATPDETANKMAQLKRKRKTIRGNITRFSVEISKIKDDSSIEDVEYTCNRLNYYLNEMKITDNEIHNLLSMKNTKTIFLQCESYNDNAEFAIFKAKKIIQNKLAPTTNNFTDLAINDNNLAMNLNPCITTPAIQSYTVKLPKIKLEPFNGDVELWQSFWEQFQSSIDNNPNLSVIDKHVFLRGYLQDEPKRLIDGISIIADTYEATKKLLMDKYGDKNRIIQAHLDFLENLTPIRNLSPTSLNEVFIECNRRLQALRALGEDVNSYGRILTPKILRAFPDDICRRWIIFAKRQKISEGNITKLIQFLSEEVEGALTTLKIRVTSTNNVDIITPKFTHLQTARVYVIGPTGKTKVTRCLLDGGSQSSFIHPSLIDFLQLEITSSEKLNLQAFESISTNTETRRRVKFILSSIWSNSKINIQAFESSNTYAFHPSTPQPVSSFAHSQKLKLADPSDSLNDLPIEILIGADFYWTIVHTKSPIKLSVTHVLIPTVFGWILTGNRSFTTIAYSSVSSVHNISSETLVRDLDDHVRQFWDLETIGIKTMQDKGMTIRNSEILSDFHNSFCKVDGRRVVKLPWKPEMQNYIDDQHVELADNSPCNESKLFYLPHHIVKKQKNDEKKWRIVFDASSHTPGHPYLNDALEQGPNLLPEIFATLLRFRLHKFAITSDGRQAFLQLILDEEDRNCTRFLWFRTEKDANGKIHLRNEILTYRFSRLPFGLTSSPFLLSATLRELANMHSDSYPTAAKHLENNIFMDDFVMGVDTAEQATTLYQEMQDLMTQISLPLAKWSTNSKNLQAIWELKDIIFKCNTQVLGINCNIREDVFHTDINESVYQFAVPATKRLLLKIVSKLYDPLGLYAPAIVVRKILFQTTWLMGVQWDEILPPGIAASFNRWVSEISSLNKIHIPRWIGISATSHMSIHVFCDASEKAYGAALYICFTELNETKVRLVCSRKRLSPLKKVTLPRLELLAALLGARLLHYFCKETGLDNQTSTLWSDSTVVLNWMRNGPRCIFHHLRNFDLPRAGYLFPGQFRLGNYRDDCISEHSGRDGDGARQLYNQFRDHVPEYEELWNVGHDIRLDAGIRSPLLHHRVLLHAQHEWRHASRRPQHHAELQCKKRYEHLPGCTACATEVLRRRRLHELVQNQLGRRQEDSSRELL